MHASYSSSLTWRLLEASIRLLDALFVPELYTVASGLVKRNTRPLCPEEVALARPIFGDSIDYTKVRLDERAHVVCRSRNCAYVSFNIINTWGPLAPATFIHELVHVWQYQTLGPVYIPRALWAQRTREGYNYGGMEALRRAAEQGRGLLDFNYEQQGDIVADYWRLLQGQKPLWCGVQWEYVPVFEKIIYTDIIR